MLAAGSQAQISMTSGWLLSARSRSYPQAWCGEDQGQELDTLARDCETCIIPSGLLAKGNCQSTKCDAMRFIRKLIYYSLWIHRSDMYYRDESQKVAFEGAEYADFATCYQLAKEEHDFENEIMSNKIGVETRIERGAQENFRVVSKNNAEAEGSLFLADNDSGLGNEDDGHIEESDAEHVKKKAKLFEADKADLVVPVGSLVVTPPFDAATWTEARPASSTTPFSSVPPEVRQSV